jgi:hypothetical protein
MSLREIIKWLHRQEIFKSKDYALVGQSLLASKFLFESKNYDELFTILTGKSEKDTANSPGKGPAGGSLKLLLPVQVEQVTESAVCFTEGSLEVTMPGILLTRSPLWANNRAPPAKFLRQLVRLAFAVYSQEPVLFVGPTCYKSLLVETWMEITAAKEKLVKVHLTPDTEASELVGQMQPYSFLDALLLIPKVNSSLVLRFSDVLSLSSC